MAKLAYAADSKIHELREEFFTQFFNQWRSRLKWTGETKNNIAIDGLVCLEQIYGAITFYLGHRRMIDEYLKEGEAKYEAMRKASREKNPELYERLARFREALSRS